MMSSSAERLAFSRSDNVSSLATAGLALSSFSNRCKVPARSPRLREIDAAIAF
jgi:hypothetical protein